MKYKSTSNEELTILWHKQAREMSFYAAAEGESWYKERPMREACSAEFKRINEEIKRRGIEQPNGNYLI